MKQLILVIHTVCYIACALAVTYELINTQGDDDLHCNSNIVISCRFSVNKSIIYWKIDNDVKNSLIIAATCIFDSCSPHSSFLTNYSFTFNQQSGVSNVTINKVTLYHTNLQFLCDDGATQDPIKLNVTEPPRKETTVMRNSTDELSVETTCVYPPDNIVIKWYSKNIDGNDRQEHTGIHSENQLCDTSSDCILANKSESITSALKLSTLTSINSSSQRSFEVEIIYGSGNYTFFVGNFFVPDKTETTTYNTVKLTPTPTIVITSTPTPVITPTQIIEISPTPTTVVSPISTIVVAQSSTDKPPSNFPSTERKKSVLIGSSTGGGVILVIIISAFVCYIQRKRRNREKAKKHMLSKEDTAVQENKL